MCWIDRKEELIAIAVVGDERKSNMWWVSSLDIPNDGSRLFLDQKGGVDAQEANQPSMCHITHRSTLAADNRQATSLNRSSRLARDSGITLVCHLRQS